MKKKKVVPRNTNQYQYLASEYIVKDKDLQLDHFSHVANNLYNAALYQLRQQWIKKHQWKSYSWLNWLFKHKYEQRESMLYASFPYRQSAQQTLREVDSIWNAWSKALKAYRKHPKKFNGKPRMPRYLIPGKRHVFYVTSQNLKIVDHYLIIQTRNRSIDFKLKLASEIEAVKRVVFKPLSKGYFKVIVQYATNKQIAYKPDNGRYLGIDPGLDNAFTCVINDNTVQPLIISGRNIKSVNQFYNKQIAKLNRYHVQNQQCFVIKGTKQGSKKLYYFSRQQQRLTDWRNAKIRSFCHQASKRIIDYALNNDINTIIIGKNKNQKRSINLGKKNNQNFVGIPHAQMINLIKYKANLQGITVIMTNESYTSQTSFLDHELPIRQNGNVQRQKKGLAPAIRRIKRGLFKTNNGTLINADVNGALQIIKKVFPKVSFTDGIAGAVLRPVKISLTC